MLSRMKSFADRQAWLDTIGGPLQGAISWVYGRGRIARFFQDGLNGVWIGHPLHPALTDVPIGAWTVTAVLDAVLLATNSNSMQVAGDVTVAIGLAGALGAALTGFTDWKDTYGREMRTGLFHGLTMVVTVVFYVASLVVRLFSTAHVTSLELSGIGLGYAGYLILVMGAYFGGEEVFGIGFGVDHTAFQQGPDDFVATIPLDELNAGEPRKVGANGVPMLLVSREEQIYALYDTCVHAGCSLAEGKLSGATVICPCHGSQFDLETGRVLHGPATTAQPRCDVRVRNGMIEVKSARA